jgi:phosphotriesterase-related protein
MTEIIRTVLGDIRPEELGVCYAHEHLIIDSDRVRVRFPELRLESVDAAVAEMAAVRRAGGNAAVDCMPGDAGRDLDKLAEIARATGMHVIAVTGLHLPKYYPEDHRRYRASAQELADCYVSEIEGGRVGAIKAASAGSVLDGHERTVLAAAAIAHRRTGAPILTHTEAGCGLEQIELLRAEGVEPDRVVLSHTDRHTDLAYHRALLATGARLVYDRVFRGALDETNPTLGLLATLLPEHPGQLLLGTDAAKPTYWRSHGGAPGLDFLLTTFVAWLRARVGERPVRRLLVENPAAAFAFYGRRNT